ncbi:MAG: hypothetical protein C0172_03500, partial [Caldisphaera sp.]
MEIGIAKDKNELKDLIQECDYVVYDGKDSFYEAIENISDKEWKLKTKVCLEQRLPNGFKLNGIHFSSIKELLMYLKESGKSKLTHEDEIIINGSLDELIDFAQQMVYLGFSPTIYTEEDYQKKVRSDRFIEKKRELLKDGNNITNKILEYKCVPEECNQIIEYRDNLLKTFNNIKESITSTDEVNISAAVFATKKSGKSMIINGILKGDYSPTSLELATPTSTEYIPVSGKTNYTLEKDGEVLNFSSVEELSREIKRYFESLQKAGNKTTKPLKVKYPASNLNQPIEIYDTPGPDRAGSEHAKYFEEYLQKTDCTVFVMDYSKHLQDSEVDILKKIQSEIDENYTKDKVLIVALNKIDLAFSDAGTSRNIVRISEFIRNELRNIGFKHVIVIPISAMWYFYGTYIKQHYPNINEIKDLADVIPNSPEETDIITVVENTGNNLRRQVGIKNPTINDLIAFTNFEIFQNIL